MFEQGKERKREGTLGVAGQNKQWWQCNRCILFEIKPPKVLITSFRQVDQVYTDTIKQQPNLLTVCSLTLHYNFIATTHNCNLLYRSYMTDPDSTYIHQNKIFTQTLLDHRFPCNVGDREHGIKYVTGEEKKKKGKRKKRKRELLILFYCLLWCIF